MTEQPDPPGTDVEVRDEGTVAPQVLEAELVEPEPAPPLGQRVHVYVVHVWRDVLPVPAEWKQAETARRAAKSVAIRAALAPIRTYPPAVARGAHLTGAAWWRWVRVRDVYESAKADGKLHTVTDDVTYHRRIRWWAMSVPPLLVATGGGIVAYVFLSTTTLVAIVFAVGCVLALVGRRKDGAPGRRAELGPRSLSWTLDPDALIERFVEAGIIKKGERLYLVERPHRDGDGMAAILDLPGTRKASDAVRSNEALASALAVDEVQLILERVRGKGGHAGRLSMWVADSDPYDRPPSRSPLADAEVWNLWDGVPWGQVARGTRVTLPIVWTALLIGALPRYGKTYAARLVATAGALDPFVRLIVFDGKGGKDWRPYELVAHRYGRGDTRDVIVRLVRVLREAVADVQRRFDVMSDMDDEICPESKVTPEITRDRKYGMPLVLIAIDEVQVYLEDEEFGKEILALLAYLARKAPAAGYSIELATQRPDSKTIPSQLRDNIGTRFAMRTKTWQASETILGTGTKVQGYDATRFLPSHKGVGLLLGADGETSLSAGEAITTRTDLLTIAEVRAACERGRAAREAAGTLTGDAAGDGDVAVVELDADTVAEVLAAADDEDIVDADVVHPLPPLLDAIVRYLDEHADDRARVPSAELLDEVVKGDEQLDMSDTAFGRQLRRWGAPSGRKRADEQRGPRVADLYSAAERIRSGGPVELAEPGINPAPPPEPGTEPGIAS